MIAYEIQILNDNRQWTNDVPMLELLKRRYNRWGVEHSAWCAVDELIRLCPELGTRLRVVVAADA